jgi:LysM repeat protein
MQITHSEARKLIQFDTDEGLRGNDKYQLENHLQSCNECRRYAENIQEVESLLRPMMQKRWNPVPLPHSTDGVISKSHSKISNNILLVTRIVAMGVVFVAFLFNIWQFTQPGGQKSNPTSAIVPPVPTPSLQSTSTQVRNQNCQQEFYSIQQNDTWESIASQFSLSKEEIILKNNLRDETLRPFTQLEIPVCSPFLTGTPRTITTMFTPLNKTTTSTPISGATQ